MARIRRRRRNPRRVRNAKGRFVKLRSNPGRRHRRRRTARANPPAVRRRRRRRNPVVRHRRRRLRRNPSVRRRRRRHNPVVHHVRRRRRHRRHNPLGVRRRRRRRNPGPHTMAMTAPGKRHRSAKQIAAAKRNLKKARAARKGGKRRSGRKLSRRLPKRLRRQVSRAQVRRRKVLRRVARRLGPGKAGKSSLAKAMHLKTNPGLMGLKVAAKVLVPQALVGGGAMLGLAFVGKKLANMITHDAAPAGAAAAGLGDIGPTRKAFQNADGTDKAIVKYMPALGTVVSTGVGYVIADKVAPKFKGAVAIGGLLGAIVQAVVAKVTADAKPDSLLAKMKDALLGDYTTVGFGDYTTVGARAYAEGGIFREVGDYTTVGGGGDNSTEFARDSLRGLDDTTEFASGEGGILSGGMFRGPSTR